MVYRNKQIPINFSKILEERSQHEQASYQVKYLIQIKNNKDEFSLSYVSDRYELIKLRDQLTKLIEDVKTSEILNIPEEQGIIIDQKNARDEICSDCSLKRSESCIECLFTLQSPLERKLFKALKKEGVFFKVQHGLDHDGKFIRTKDKSFNNPKNNFKDVLTIPDFFIDYGTNKEKLCVYTDGHTYHERTEDQAKKDRNIDRKLQALGFKVLRYTGKEVNDSMDKIIKEIKGWL